MAVRRAEEGRSRRTSRFKICLTALERIGSHVEKLGNAHRRQRLAPDIKTLTPLLGKDNLEPPHAHGRAVAVVAPVDETLS
jgi:hypothetical protein